MLVCLHSKFWRDLSPVLLRIDTPADEDRKLYIRYRTANILLAYLVVFAADDWKAAIEGNYLR